MRTFAVLLLAATLGVAAAAFGDDKSPSVTYIESAKVAAAFARGAPLIEVEDYKVHASRREAPGQAEIHETDTDIIYVLEGTATFVTGGNVKSPQMVAPQEIRGSAIEGGKSYALSKGDLMVVPAGTPHWFKAVDAPFLYYVVKVTRQENGT